MNSILNIANRVISVYVLSASPIESWPYADYPTDPWWSGSSNKPYRWQINVNVNLQTHSSNLTRDDYEYNGLDIYVGDWIAGITGSPKACKIVSVISKTFNSATFIIEDENRYNTFNDSNQLGDGIFTTPGDGIIFQLSEDGSPILDPLPVTLTDYRFASQVQSRFLQYKPSDRVKLEQTSHNFIQGDSISINDSGQFEKTDPDSISRIIGTVVETGPGPNFFFIRPNTKVVENIIPVLPGGAGDFVYADPNNPGELTTTNTGAPIYLQLTNSTPTIINGTVINAITSAGYALKINGETVILSGTNISSAVSDINLSTSLHKVIASNITAPTVATTSPVNLAYGVVAGGTPFSATINGILVNFTTTTSGSGIYGPGFADQNDMATDINAASIPNITATGVSAAQLNIINSSGGNITIVNGTNDTGGFPFAGASSVTGLPLSTIGSGSTFLRLTRNDGAGIILADVIGTPLADFGITSAQNGKIPVGLVVEQGIRKGDMYVVADITARNALDVLIGDQAYVINKGDGEWGMYLWNGSWIVTGTAESATVDSRTVSFTLNFSSPISNIIAEVNGGVRVGFVTVDVLTPFNGTPTLDIGIAGNLNVLLDNNIVDLNTIGTYVSTPSYQMGSGVDRNIIATYGAGGATIGQARIAITYS